MKSSFCGVIAEVPFISVDNFQNTSKSAYFLSHYHYDHFIGLDNSCLPAILKENKAYIYASEVTIAIIKWEQRENLHPYLKVLKLGRDTLTINNNGEEVLLNVTTLPAGHCSGSVMFLFEHNNKTALYTGDFRITQNDIRRYTHLHDKKGDPIHIDTLYIDTTFQTVPFFPRRSDVISNVVDRVKHWLSLDEKNVVHLKTSATYGYEFLANYMYDTLKIKTYAGDYHWHIFSQFPKEMYGITDDRNSRIKLSFFKKTGYMYLPEEEERILTIFFSARSWCNDNKNEDFIRVNSENSIDVCFSLHCGRDELIYLVNYFQPAKVVGFPNDLIRDSPVKKEAITPLNIQFSNSSKRLRDDSDGEVVRKKLSRDRVKRMFDW